MKKLALLTTAAFAVVALGVSSAWAQDTTKKESKGEVATPPTVATIVVILDNSLPTVAKIGMIKVEAAPKLELVDVRPFVEGTADEPKYKEALEKNKDAIKQVQEELKKHDFIVKAISEHAQKPEPGDIIGAEVTADNRLVLYFWKK